jgi:hypothetical protein
VTAFAAWLADSRAASGLGPKVDSDTTLQRIALMVRGAVPPPSSSAEEAAMTARGDE